MPREVRALLLPLLLAGCAAAAEAGLGVEPARGTSANSLVSGLHPGEAMSYEVRLGGVLVGDAQLAVGAEGVIDGRRALIVRSRAATAGAAALLKNVVDESVTTIDLDTGRPMRVETLAVAGQTKITALATFGTGRAEVEYRRYRSPEDSPSPQRMTLRFRDEQIHDMHTAMAAVRSWRGEPGAVRQVFVVGGRRLWKIDLTLVGTEVIRVREGSRRAVVLDGVAFRARRDLSPEARGSHRTFRVWLSDDADRVPLRCTATTEMGNVAMDLIEYVPAEK